MERHEDPRLDDESLWRLARQIRGGDRSGYQPRAPVARCHPTKRRSSPGLRTAGDAREYVRSRPQTCRSSSFARRLRRDWGLRTCRPKHRCRRQRSTRRSRAKLDAGDVRGFLAGAVAARKSILISGGTATGKTTLLNALLKEAPPKSASSSSRTPEVQLAHANSVGLVAVRGRLGEASVSAADLLEAALRLRPDRIIMGEIRGSEALSFPPRGEHRPSRIDHHHPRKLARWRDRTTRADRPRSRCGMGRGELKQLYPIGAGRRHPGWPQGRPADRHGRTVTVGHASGRLRRRPRRGHAPSPGNGAYRVAPKL